MGISGGNKNTAGIETALQIIIVISASEILSYVLRKKISDVGQ